MKHWPKSVTVAGLKYRILYVAHEQEVDRNYSSADYSGQGDHALLEVRVARGSEGRPRSASQIFEILLHEIVHAILSANKLLQVVFAGEGKEEHSEPAVDALARALFDTFTRNGWLTVPEGLPKEEKR